LSEQPYQPSHRVPAAGLRAWTTPDPDAAPAGTLGPGLDVHVVQRRGGWAQIQCSNGWAGWVDASALQPIGAPTPAATSQVPAEEASGLLALLEKVSSIPLLGAVVVFLFALLVSQLLWPVLGFPADIISSPFTDANCADLETGSGSMFTCSAKVGLYRCIGAIVVGLVMLVFTRPIQRQIQKVKRRLPRQSHFLIGPLVGTAAFTSIYAGIHSDTASANGFVNQRTFPAVIGVLGYLAPVLGRFMSTKAPTFFDRRDKIPPFARILVAIGIPLLLAYFLNNQDRVTDTAKKEQTTVLLTMTMTFLMVLPKSGDLAGKASSFMTRVPGGIR
jgi:hypothetical protein